MESNFLAALVDDLDREVVLESLRVELAEELMGQVENLEMEDLDWFIGDVRERVKRILSFADEDSISLDGQVEAGLLNLQRARDYPLYVKLMEEQGKEKFLDFASFSGSHGYRQKIYDNFRALREKGIAVGTWVKEKGVGIPFQVKWIDKCCTVWGGGGRICKGPQQLEVCGKVD